MPPRGRSQPPSTIINRDSRRRADGRSAGSRGDGGAAGRSGGVSPSVPATSSTARPMVSSISATKSAAASRTPACIRAAAPRASSAASARRSSPSSAAPAAREVDEGQARPLDPHPDREGVRRFRRPVSADRFGPVRPHLVARGKVGFGEACPQGVDQLVHVGITEIRSRGDAHPWRPPVAPVPADGQRAIGGQHVAPTPVCIDLGHRRDHQVGARRGALDQVEIGVDERCDRRGDEDHGIGRSPAEAASMTACSGRRSASTSARLVTPADGGPTTAMTWRFGAVTNSRRAVEAIPG